MFVKDCHGKELLDADASIAEENINPSGHLDILKLSYSLNIIFSIFYLFI